mmetsp:Transcript_39938/g.99972  ORF Transcript_39938/g.99972 Transcript_39938/m.99972 type:complete len:435 (+) Transcript_39938:436-1740(+)
MDAQEVAQDPPPAVPARPPLRPHRPPVPPRPPPRLRRLVVGPLPHRHPGVRPRLHQVRAVGLDPHRHLPPPPLRPPLGPPLAGRDAPRGALARPGRGRLRARHHGGRAAHHRPGARRERVHRAGPPGHPRVGRRGQPAGGGRQGAAPRGPGAHRAGPGRVPRVRGPGGDGALPAVAVARGERRGVRGADAAAARPPRRGRPPRPLHLQLLRVPAGLLPAPRAPPGLGRGAGRELRGGGAHHDAPVGARRARQAAAGAHRGRRLPQDVLHGQLRARRHAPGQHARVRGGGDDLRLVLLDAGITTELSDRDKENFVLLFSAIVKGDGREAGRLMLDNAREHRCEDPEAFCEGMRGLVEEALGSKLRLESVSAGDVLRKAFSLACTHRVKIESNFASICIAIMVLEGVGRRLDPTLDILNAAVPVLAARTIRYKAGL